MEILYHSIGIIHSPFTDMKAMPIQPAGAQGIKGWVEVFDDFLPGLKDLEGFSHLILLYHFHKSTQYALQVTPFLDSQPRGVFATRAPQRPNGIGLSVVKLLTVEENQLFLENIDILDGTPLVDIKPYVPDFDGKIDDLRKGWLESQVHALKSVRSDARFE